MATMMNTVSTETINPKGVMGLPFIDVDLSSVVIPIRSEKEALLLLKGVRGF